MRYLVLLLVLIFTTAADAEQRGRGRGGQRRAQSAPTPRAEALSRNIPPRLLLPAGENRFPSDMRMRPFRGGMHHQGSRWPWWMYAGSPYYGGGYYGGGYYGSYASEYVADVEPQSAPPPAMTQGVVNLEITPATGLQYFVDGVYFGSSAELGTQFEITAGVRRIEVRAAGYKPLTFDARITAGATVTFRGALEPDGSAVTVIRPVGNRTMYVIPGCYMGNSPPNAAALPKGCDARKIVTRGGL